MKKLMVLTGIVAAAALELGADFPWAFISLNRLGT